MKRRMLSILLTLMMLVTMVPAIAEVDIAAQEIQAESVEEATEVAIAEADPVSESADDVVLGADANAVIEEDAAEVPEDEGIVPVDDEPEAEEVIEETVEEIDASLSEIIVAEDMDDTDLGNSPKAANEWEIPIDEEHFPDPVFRNYIKEYIARGDVLTESDAALVTRLDLDNMAIGDLTGISYFTNLSELECNQNELEELDVTGCTHLSSLYCVMNQLKTLNVSGLAELDLVWCYENQLETVKVSGCTNLRWLDCNFNKLQELDLRGLTNLEFAWCVANQLNTLLFGTHDKLNSLWCTCNQLSAIDISGCSKLVSVVNPEYYSCWTDHYEYDTWGNPYGPVTACDYMSDDSEPSIRMDATVSITGGSPVPPVVPKPELPKVKVTKNRSASAFIGEKFQITLGSNKAKSLVSSKKTVATVTKAGVVTPKASGTTKITVTLKTGKQLVLTLKVIDPMMPKSVTLDQTKAAMYLGNGTLTLYATMTASKEGETAVSGLTWKSSNTKIAKVNSQGVVTPVKAGTAKITVITTRGGKTATCTVTVRDPNMPRAVALDQTAVKLFAGEVKNLRLTPTLSWWVEELATNKNETITWSSSDKTVAKVSSSGLVTPMKSGKATITAKTANGKKATCVVTITKNKIDSIHAKPTASQIKRLAGSRPTGILKSVEIVNRNKIVLEWYLMNCKAKVLTKTPSMAIRVGYMVDAPVPDESSDSGDDFDDYVDIVFTDYDHKTVNVPAYGYKLIKVTLTPGKCIEFKADIKLSTVKSKLDWVFEEVGE